MLYACKYHAIIHSNENLTFSRKFTFHYFKKIECEIYIYDNGNKISRFFEVENISIRYMEVGTI